ncbi:collagen alpha-1(I) chain-like [Perognathus longimembris pacificus]|uniref:collagen alpha-1(I) chain-like n=1 Tax=Perognathus longimembris pacificus TaxID=214514 RepID=UPI00201943AA|nr:collagen alpha-1(I) chain-like [Perognathus longimembris pacificus]
MGGRALLALCLLAAAGGRRGGEPGRGGTARAPQPPPRPPAPRAPRPAPGSPAHLPAAASRARRAGTRAAEAASRGGRAGAPGAAGGPGGRGPALGRMRHHPRDGGRAGAEGALALDGRRIYLAAPRRPRAPRAPPTPRAPRFPQGGPAPLQPLSEQPAEARTPAKGIMETREGQAGETAGHTDLVHANALSHTQNETYSLGAPSSSTFVQFAPYSPRVRDGGKDSTGMKEGVGRRRLPVDGPVSFAATEDVGEKGIPCPTPGWRVTALRALSLRRELRGDTRGACKCVASRQVSRADLEATGSAAAGLVTSPGVACVAA